MKKILGCLLIVILTSTAVTCYAFEGTMKYARTAQSICDSSIKLTKEYNSGDLLFESSDYSKGETLSDGKFDKGERKGIRFFRLGETESDEGNPGYVVVLYGMQREFGSDSHVNIDDLLAKYRAEFPGLTESVEETENVVDAEEINRIIEEAKETARQEGLTLDFSRMPKSTVRQKTVVMTGENIEITIAYEMRIDDCGSGVIRSIYPTLGEKCKKLSESIEKSEKLTLTIIDTAQKAAYEELAARYAVEKAKEAEEAKRKAEEDAHKSALDF